MASSPSHSRLRERLRSLEAAGAQLLGWLSFSALYWIVATLVDVSTRGDGLAANAWPASGARWVQRLGVILSVLVAGVAFSIVPIRRQRRIAELQREREATSRMLQTVLDTTPLRVFWKDRDGRYLGCNMAFAQDHGCSPDDIAGRRDADLFPPRVVEQILASDLQVVESGTPIVGREEQFQARGQPMRRIRSTVSPLVDATGNVTGVLGSYEDITEQHLAREELERSRLHAESANAELEERVRERTADLVLLNHELETFAHSAAHDLRTPLRAIDGWTHAVLEECHHGLDIDARTKLERVRAAAQRIGETLDDLLRLSQVSRSGFRPQEIDLARLVRTHRDMFVAMQPERRFEWIVPENLPLRGDPELLRLMLWNLLDNAVKFTSRRDVARIEVGIDGRGLFVRDNGVGFDMAHSGKLFKAFQRLHLPEEFAGTGVGLAVVRRIAERHGGHMEAEGAPEAGATFWFVPPRTS